MVEPAVPVDPVRDANALFARIFVPVLSTASQRAVMVALDLKRAFDSDVCLFTLADVGVVDEFRGQRPVAEGDPEQRALESLRGFVEHIAPDAAGQIELRAETKFRSVDDIHQEADRWGATLVLAATEFSGGLLRSPAEKLVHEFDVPVLLIPAVDDREFNPAGAGRRR